MRLIDFVKSAGKALGFGKGEDDSGKQGEPPTPDADAIRREVESHGLEAEELEIEVDGDTVEARGRAMTEELREKIIVAVGNIAGVARVRDRMKAEKAGDASQFHTVAKGDTLWAISAKHYGNGAHYREIFEANRPMLDDPDKIYPGQVLRIPPRG